MRYEDGRKARHARTKALLEIDLDESPIIALSCGHLFTVETLDGHIDLKEVYEQDHKTGHYTALVENAQLAVTVPQCPYCKMPIRQYVTQRYNRLINKAVVDEMTKRFIVSGQKELQDLEADLTTLEKVTETSRASVVPSLKVPTGDSAAMGRVLEYINYFLNNSLEKRYTDAHRLEQRIKNFLKRTATQNQPASKLHQATVHAITKNRGLDSAFEELSLGASVNVTKHGGAERINHGSHLLHIRIQSLVLEDKFGVARSLKSRYLLMAALPDPVGSHLVAQCGTYLNNCSKMIETCKQDLPKLAVEATLYYSCIAQLLVSSGLVNDKDRKRVEAHRDMAKELLNQAAELCKQPFKGAKELAQAVEGSLRLLGKEFYSEVSKEEIAAIKKAIISGPGGIATHSGHWYKCVKGHPVSTLPWKRDQPLTLTVRYR
jgi:hypothetical protein